MRSISESLYGIPPERVIGSSLRPELERGRRPRLQGRLEFFDDGPRKPVRIWSRIGQRPSVGGGNSNGDIPMLRFHERHRRCSSCTTTPSASSRARPAPRTPWPRGSPRSASRTTGRPCSRDARSCRPGCGRPTARGCGRTSSPGVVDLERGSPAGRRLRADRRAAAGGGPDGGAGRDARLRAARHLAPARGQRDDGHVRGLSGDRRAAGGRRHRRFAALSAALALVVGVVLVVRRLAALRRRRRPRVQARDDRLPVRPRPGDHARAAAAVLGVPAGEGNFFPALSDVLGELGDVHGRRSRSGPCRSRCSCSAGGSCRASRYARRARARHRGVRARGTSRTTASTWSVTSPTALPDPALPDVAPDDFVDLVAPAIGILILSAEASAWRVGSPPHGYQVDPNRDLVAMGAANLLPGCRRASCSRAARARPRRPTAPAAHQFASLVAAGAVLLTGAFLAPLFTDLPQATLAAIVIVAVAGFFDVAELRRYARVRLSAIPFAPSRSPASLRSASSRASWSRPCSRWSSSSSASAGRPWPRSRGTPARAPGAMRTATTAGRRPRAYWSCAATVRCSTPTPTRSRTACSSWRRPGRSPTVVLDLDATNDLDIQGADTLGELAAELRRQGMELRLARVRAPVRGILERTGVAKARAGRPDARRGHRLAPYCSLRDGRSDRPGPLPCVGVSLSPVPIIAVVLILGTPRRARTGRPSCSVGSWAWRVVGGIVLVLAEQGRCSPGGRHAHPGQRAEARARCPAPAVAARQWRGARAATSRRNSPTGCARSIASRLAVRSAIAVALLGREPEEPPTRRSVRPRRSLGPARHP